MPSFNPDVSLCHSLEGKTIGKRHPTKICWIKVFWLQLGQLDSVWFSFINFANLKHTSLPKCYANNSVNTCLCFWIWEEKIKSISPSFIEKIWLSQIVPLMLDIPPCLFVLSMERPLISNAIPSRDQVRGEVHMPPKS